MATLAELKSKWFIPLSGDVLGVPCRRHTMDGGSPQLSASTDGNTVIPLIDGASYMRRWHEALVAMTAVTENEVYHASWRLNGVHTLGGTTGTSALEDLRDARTNGATVYALLSMHGTDVDNQVESLPRLQLHGVRSACLDTRFPALGSNHQKMAVFKTSNVDVALLGSIDVNRGRWDRPAHAHRDDSRPTKEPTHDTGVQIEGPATADLDLCFRERWNDSSRTFGMLPTLLPQPLISTRIANGLANGSHSVQVTRTYGLTNRFFGYSWYDRGEFTVWASYLNAITKATQYIYIEDQYFFPWDFPPRYARKGDVSPGRAVDIVYRLGEAIKRGVSVAVLVPRKSEDPIVAKSQQFQRNLGVNYLHEVVSKLRADHPLTEPLGDLVVACLHNGTEDIFVHSKLMLVDDEVTLIGSANVGARSMAHDGEVNVTIVDAQETFTREFRKTLWAEHTGRPPDDFHSPAAGFTAFKESSMKEPPGRLRTYSADPAHVFPPPEGTELSLPPGHQTALRAFIDPYAGPAALV